MRFYPWAGDAASTSEYVQDTPRCFSVCLTADLSYWSFASSRKQSDFKGNKIVKHVYIKIDLKYFMALDTRLAISIHYNKNLISWTQCFKTKRQMTKLFKKHLLGKICHQFTFSLDPCRVLITRIVQNDNTTLWDADLIQKISYIKFFPQKRILFFFF